MRLESLEQRERRLRIALLGAADEVEEHVAVAAKVCARSRQRARAAGA
jgi:hypothetical protein